MLCIHSRSTPYLPSFCEFSKVGTAIFECLINVFNSSISSAGVLRVNGLTASLMPPGGVEKDMMFGVSGRNPGVEDFSAVDGKFGRDLVL